MLFAFEVALFLFLMPLILAIIAYCGVAILYVIGVMLCVPFAPTILGFIALIKAKNQYEEYCFRQKIRKEKGTYRKVYWYYPACFAGGFFLFFCGLAYAAWFISYIDTRYFN